MNDLGVFSFLDRKPAKNVAPQFGVERDAQDRNRADLASQGRDGAARRGGGFDAEMASVSLLQERGEAIIVAKDS